MLVTFCVFHIPIPWLNTVAFSKQLVMSVTFAVSQLTITPLNVEQSLKVSFISSTVGGQNVGRVVKLSHPSNPFSNEVKPFNAHFVAGLMPYVLRRRIIQT